MNLPVFSHDLPSIDDTTVNIIFTTFNQYFDERHGKLERFTKSFN